VLTQDIHASPYLNHNHDYQECSRSSRDRLLTTDTEDLATASAKVKGEMPGRPKQAEKTAETWATEAGQKLDSAVRAPPPSVNTFYPAHQTCTSIC
jgi:hypothetical protein